MAYNLILRAIEAPGGSANAHLVLIHYSDFANSKEGNKAWPTYATVAKACHFRKRQTVADAVQENIDLGYLVPIGNIDDKKTWAKKVYPDGKWAYIFAVKPPPLQKHNGTKSGIEGVRKTDILKEQDVHKTDIEGVRKTDTILGIYTTVESLSPTSTLKPSAEGGDITQELVPTVGTLTCTHSGDTNIPSNIPSTTILKPSAEGGDIIPSVTKEEYFDALAAKQSAEGKVKRKERYIQQLEIFAKRLHGKRAEDIATIIAQEKMRKSELEIRLKRAERAMPA